jgi:hypothetical protein
MITAKKGQMVAVTFTPPIREGTHNAFKTIGNTVLWRAVTPFLVLTAMNCVPLPAQTPQTSVLTVEMQNVVEYQEGFANPSKNGTSTAMEAQNTSPATFFPGTILADIVAVNGTKAKGTTVARMFWVGLNSNPSGSQAIADVNRFQAMDIVFEIQQADGTSLGTIFLSGVTGGTAPAGAPSAGVTGNFAVTGGTGAFLGVRGQAATIMNSHRTTSNFENPLNRRTFSGGLWKMAVELVPMHTPEVVANSDGPVIVHSNDYSLVTAVRPAHAGEVLTLLASGLGPTRPGLDPGNVFTAGPAQIVNSPVDVLVNGKAGDFLYAGGYPGTADNYQVNFRVPADTAPGTAALQLRAAWIAGGQVKIAIQ